MIAIAMDAGVTVVASEKPFSPEGPRAPTVCAAQGVRRIGLMAMIRELGWAYAT